MISPEHFMQKKTGIAVRNSFFPGMAGQLRRMAMQKYQ